MFWLCFALIATQIGLTSSKIVYYKFGEKNSKRTIPFIKFPGSINACITEAISKLRQDTCVHFSSGQAPKTETVISFVESGHCSWQDNNATVHLARHCINADTCSKIIAKALTNDRIHYDAARHLNIKFNCTDKCTILCQNGGEITSDCKCKCGYGLGGQFCEKLSMAEYFTDSSCGVITEGEGSISLSSYPNSMPRDSFCQWLIKPKHPWETVEFTFLEMDLNSQDALPGANCADSLVVLGAKGLQTPTIPCNSEFAKIRGRPFRSDGDWVMFVLNGNKRSAGHKGPLIQYKVVSQLSSKEIRSFNADAFSSAGQLLHAISHAVLLLLGFAMLKF